MAEQKDEQAMQEQEKEQQRVCPSYVERKKEDGLQGASKDRASLRQAEEIEG